MVQEAIINDFQMQNFKLISVHEGPDLLSDDATRKLIRQVMGAIAEYDKTMTVLKLRAARERIRARNGKCEGRKGYADVSPEVIAEIKRMRRKRKGTAKLMTYKEIAAELTRQGMKSRMGKQFTAEIVHNILQWNSQSA